MGSTNALATVKSRAIRLERNAILFIPSVIIIGVAAVNNLINTQPMVLLEMRQSQGYMDTIPPRLWISGRHRHNSSCHISLFSLIV